MKVRLHPILIPVFLFLIVSGNVSTYTLVFLSLLIHEAGHMIAAKMVGMRVRSCTIMPYGGELVIPGRHMARRRKRFYVALGGPAATMILYILATLIQFPSSELFARIQLILLGVNLLPFLPLDGGHALSAFIEQKGKEYEARIAMIVHSILFYTIVIIMLSFFLPETLLYILLAFFLLLQNIASYRYRRYEKVLYNIKKK